MTTLPLTDLPHPVRRAVTDLGLNPEDIELTPIAQTWSASTWSLRSAKHDGILKVRPFDLGAAILADPDPRLTALTRIFPLPPFFCRLETLLAPMRSVLGAKIPQVLAEGRLEDGARYALMSRIAGQRLASSWPHDPARKRHVSQQLGALLAQLHTAPVPSELAIDTRHWLAAVDETMHCVADHLANIDRRPRRRRHTLHTRFTAVCQRLRAQPLGNVVLNHGDFHPDNLLFSAEGDVAGLVDFDVAGVGPAALDLRHVACLDETTFAAAYGIARDHLDGACWTAHTLDLLWHGLALIGQHRFGGEPAKPLPWARAVAHVDYLLALSERDDLRRGAPRRRVFAERMLQVQAAWRTAGTPRRAKVDRSTTTGRVAIVVVAFNHFATTTGPCLAALRRYTDVPYRVICIDNASSDETAAALTELARHDPRLEVVQLDSNQGWAGGSLAGLARLHDDDQHVVLLNSDTQVMPGWLTKLLAHHRRTPAPNVVTPLETPPHPRANTRTEPPITPGTGALPARAPAHAELLRHAACIERRNPDRCAEATPSGFCLLFARSSQPVVEEYLRDFANFHSGARPWHSWWHAQATRGLVALDCYVYHARGGSGGYYAYDREA